MQLGHVRLLRVGRLVGEVLNHLRNKGEGSARPVGWLALDEHVRLRGHDGWVDEAQEEESSNQCANHLVIGFGILALSQAANLLANPSDSVWSLLKAINNSGEEVVGDFSEHRQSRFNDSLNLVVLCSLLGGNALGQVWWERTSLLFNLLQHALVNLEGIDFQV